MKNIVSQRSFSKGEGTGVEAVGGGRFFGGVEGEPGVGGGAFGGREG